MTHLNLRNIWRKQGCLYQCFTIILVLKATYFQVTINSYPSGVSDEEQAQNVVEFATSVELLKKQEAQKLRLEELNLADIDSIQSALPR